jgi:hypothetical protein
MNNESESVIGYGRPPKRTRFQKGLSGNPKGRPRGKRNFATVLAETLRQEMVIKENGVRKTVTKLEAALIKLANRAASGDLNATRLLIALVRSAEERAIEPPTKELSETDRKIMQRVLQRQSKCVGGENGEDH